MKKETLVAIVEALKEGKTPVFPVEDFPCFEPEGAFYVFPSIQSTGYSSEEFCTQLLQKEHVAVVPGSAFGASGEGFVRISYSYSMKHLTDAMERIERFLHEKR